MNRNYLIKTEMLLHYANAQKQYDYALYIYRHTLVYS
jgi:hypothetical protein